MRPHGALLPLAAAALLLTPRPAAAAASAWAVNGPSRVRLITPWRVAPASGTGELRLGLHFLLAPEWHVYWKNSGDAGYPPSIALSGSPLQATGELLWPAPRRFALRGGLVALGYEREVVYPVRVRQPAGSGSSERSEPSERWTAEVDYLVCQVDCIPFHSRLVVEQPLGPQALADPETSALVEHGWSQLPLAVGTQPGALAGVSATTAYGNGPDGKPALSVDVRGVKTGLTGATGEKGAPGADLFLEPQDLFETGRPEVTRQAAGVHFRIPLTPRQVGKPLPASFPFAWTATGLAPLRGKAGPLALSDRETVDLRPAAAAAPVSGRARPLRALGIAGLALLSTLVALGLWGLLGSGRVRTRPEKSAGRGAAGFLAALGTLGALYLLSRSVTAEGLAGVELALLTMALFAWLRRIAAGGSKLSWALWIALGLSAGAALWCAGGSSLG
jgi:DsbC/DsbD-like thiol-disulfide interchange protein